MKKKLIIHFIIIVLLIVVIGLVAIIQLYKAQQNIILVTTLLIASISIIIFIFTSIIKEVKRKIYWYESMLDSIPFPISVTDNNMNWTFINKPVEDILKVKRDDVLGKHCSNWGAGICKTDKCGINCLRSGKNITYFNQINKNFQVNTNYLFDENNQKVGHIEVVQDISLIKDQAKKIKFVNKIKELCNSFITVAENLAQSSQHIAQDAAFEDEFIEKLSKAFTDLSNKSKLTSNLAKQASSVTDKIKFEAELGNTQMEKMFQSVNEMAESTRSINEIIKSIDDIAFQTNILALNAAIEASRVGEAGKGFAVVAEAVRELATKSTEAAKYSNILIENSLKKAELSEQIVHQTTNTFKTIVNGISLSDENTKIIEKSSIEQISHFEKLNADMGKMVDIIQQNSATSQENAAVSEELSSQTSLLEKLILEFEEKNNSK